MKSGFPANVVVPLADGFSSNVFRHTYAINKNSLFWQIADKRKIPPFFRNPCIKNVSDQYTFDMHSITYDTTPELEIKNGIAYLAVFGYGDNLRKVAYTNIVDNKMKFDHIGSGIVYLICTYKNEELIPFSHPVVLRDSSGTIEILKPDTINRQKMILTRKCKVSLQMLEFAEAMKGARFEDSENPEFKQSDTLYEIKDTPFFLVEKETGSKRTYRYVRYISPQNSIHLAEIEFWSKDEKNQDIRLTGTPIVHFGSDSLMDSKPEYAFDNNIRTNFNAPSGSWIGLDLKQPALITQVKYLPRNNFNVIEVGNEYELMYYNYGWKLLGV
ncbi:MAG: discoidin domain-containing protein [Bacteroides sp.]|nr:discoidin domain-containing protein [Bacteroides sp.]